MKSKAAGCRLISTIISSIVLLCVSSIIVKIITIIIMTIIIIKMHIANLDKNFIFISWVYINKIKKIKNIKITHKC